jgi:hypothetical protein
MTYVSHLTHLTHVAFVALIFCPTTGRRKLAFLVGCWLYLSYSWMHVTVGASRHDHFAFVSSIRTTRSSTISCFCHKSFSLHSTTTVEEEIQDPTYYVLSPEQADQFNLLVEERSRARWQGGLHSCGQAARPNQNPFPALGLSNLGPRHSSNIVEDPMGILVLTQESPSSLLSGPTVLQLAHIALGLAIESSAHTNLGRAHLSLGKQRSSSNSIV